MNKIQPGDTVNVHYSWTRHMGMEVVAVPGCVGECWILKKDTKLVYVQTFEYIELVKKGDKK